MPLRTAVVMGVLLSACGDSKEVKLRKIRDSGSPIEATPSDLVDAYRSSEIAGDKKFLGKPIRLSATVDKIRRGKDGSPFAIVHEYHQDSENKQVGCLLDGDLDLPIGPKVILRCVGAGLAENTPALAACKPE